MSDENSKSPELRKHIGEPLNEDPVDDVKQNIEAAIASVTSFESAKENETEQDDEKTMEDNDSVQENEIVQGAKTATENGSAEASEANDLDSMAAPAALGNSEKPSESSTSVEASEPEARPTVFGLKGSLEIKKSSRKRPLKNHDLSDFEYNVDSSDSNSNTGGTTETQNTKKDNVKSPISQENQNHSGNEATDNNNTTPPKKRSLRKVARQRHYTDGSADENSPEEPDFERKGNKKQKYYSDDEYTPEKPKRTSVDKDEKEESESQPPKKKRGRKKKKELSEEENKVSNSSKNEEAIPDQTLTEDTSKPSVNMKIEIDCIPTFSMAHVFDDVVPKTPPDNTLEFDLHPLPLTNEEISQNTESKFVQTVSPTLITDIKVSDNIHLSDRQSEVACALMKGTLTSAIELGSLIGAKANEFIVKKISTEHIQDTAGLDSSMKKIFLLFKLVKDNLITMEESLLHKYKQFLSDSELESKIEYDKEIAVNKKDDNSDSDCEIIEEGYCPAPIVPDEEKFRDYQKTKMLPSQLLLNKDISIKITKKISTDEGISRTPKGQQISIPGRHAVWINNSIMVKKVKSQKKSNKSFFCQDSRTMKPPDSNSHYPLFAQ